MCKLALNPPSAFVRKTELNLRQQGQVAGFENALKKPLLGLRGCSQMFWLSVLLAVSVLPCIYAEEMVDLSKQTASFTNLEGRVYYSVQLERATEDGLIYSQTNTGTIGMVHYSDLPTNFLASLKIPDSIIAKAAAHQNELAIEKERYQESVYRLAMQNLTNAPAYTNTPQSQVPAAQQPTSTASSRPEARPARAKSHRRR